jgi:carboxylesterase type B
MRACRAHGSALHVHLVFATKYQREALNNETLTCCTDSTWKALRRPDKRLTLRVGRVRGRRRPGWPRYEPETHATMVFADDGSRLEKDPFAFARETWSGLHWQPGPWWAIEGVS